jgi:type VI secretion system protein ImpH
LSDGAVQIEADPSLVFPASDIISCRFEESRVVVRVAFMGLTGVSSPLPAYFTQTVRREDGQGTALRDFLSIFDHRLYTLFYRAWKKYRYIYNLRPDYSDTFSALVRSLAGLQGVANTDHLLGCAGVMGSGCRSAEGLKSILCAHFLGVAVSIKECVPAWIRLTQLTALGQGAILGDTALCGERVYDRTQSIGVEIGPVDRHTYERFLPGRAEGDLLHELIALYLPQPLHYTVTIHIARRELSAAVLGDEQCGRLGETLSLGRSRIAQQMESITLEPPDK